MIKISPPCLMKFYVFSLHLQKIIKNTLLLLVCILPFFLRCENAIFPYSFSYSNLYTNNKGGELKDLQ